jgi:hypothetical protein
MFSGSVYSSAAIIRFGMRGSWISAARLNRVWRANCHGSYIGLDVRGPTLDGGWRL